MLQKKVVVKSNQNLDVLTQKLSELSPQQMNELILNLVRSDEDIYNTIVLLVEHLDNSETKTQKIKMTVDPKIIIREIAKIFSLLDGLSYSESYRAGKEVISKLSYILQRAQKFLAINDAQNALLILKILADEFIAEWSNLYRLFDEAGQFVSDLDETLCEAILLANVDEVQASTILNDIEAWCEEVGNHGYEDCFRYSLRALEEGWDSVDIKSILSGAYDKPRETHRYERRVLAKIRLSILDRQKRFMMVPNSIALRKAISSLGAGSCVANSFKAVP